VARKVQRKQKNAVVVDRKGDLCQERTEEPPSKDCVLEWNVAEPEFPLWDKSSLSLFSPPTPLSLSLEDVATNYFLSFYVPGSHFEYLPGVFESTSNDPVLFTSIRAAALATLSLELVDPSIMSMARNQYSRALAITNKALAVPQEAVLDSTLISVLLLGLFETVAKEGRGGVEDWDAHTQGAGTLLSLRGKGQFDTPLGCRLFSQVSSNIKVSSLQRQVRVPPDILKLHELGKPFLEHDHQRVQFWRHLDAFGNLRAFMAEEKCLDSAVVIQSALQIDKRIFEMLSSLPSMWQYQVRPTAQTAACTYGTAFHQYPTHRIAQTWNSLRMMRLFLKELVHGKIIQATESYTALSSDTLPISWIQLQEQVALNVQKMAEEICASVPHLAQGKPSPMVAASLLWPLAAVGDSELISNPVRAYAIDRLHFLGTQARFPQALWAAKMLEESKSLEDWCVVATRLSNESIAS